MNATTAMDRNLPARRAAAGARLQEFFLERDLLDWLIRVGIRRMLRQRLQQESAGGTEQQQSKLESFVEQLRASAVASETQAANEQHYEVPASLFELVLPNA